MRLRLLQTKGRTHEPYIRHRLRHRVRAAGRLAPGPRAEA